MLSKLCDMNELLSMQRSTNVKRSIEVIGLSKVYCDGRGRLEIFKGVSFGVNEGETVAILGPSGSGKTTLLNLMSGLDTPDSGEVELTGVKLSSLSEAEKTDFRNQNVGFVFQFYHLLAELTALENVMLPAWISSRQSFDPGRVREKALQILKSVGLHERLQHFPSELSGGEQQRVAIARALMNDPQILFCDEPTGNLDRSMGLEIAELLKSFIKEKKKTLILVTHDEQMAALSDRVWNMVTCRWEN